MEYLCSLMDAYLSKDDIPEGINDLLFCFAPKPSGGPTPENDDIVFKHPSETRPLSLKVFYNKVIACALNQSMTPIVSKHANGLQRGFVHQR